MTGFDIALQNLASPMTLCFLLGVVAVAARSDLTIPEPVSAFLAIYLMLAVGLKGGADLSGADLRQALPVLASGVAIGLAIPLWIYLAGRRLAGFGVADSAALAAHYGSVSAVTFIAAASYLDAAGIRYEPYVTALMAVMEVPGVVMALLIARLAQGRGLPLGATIARMLASKSVVLLAGGLAIGAIVGQAGMAPVKPFFSDLFRGVLCLFLLDLGLKTAARAGIVRRAAPALLLIGIAAPLANAALGLAVAGLLGLSVGGATILATLAASASYIVAPAAVRGALPEADPALALTASLAVTFPFNLLVGLPLYTAAASALYG